MLRGVFVGCSYELAQSHFAHDATPRRSRRWGLSSQRRERLQQRLRQRERLRRLRRPGWQLRRQRRWCVRRPQLGWFRGEVAEPLAMVGGRPDSSIRGCVRTLGGGGGEGEGRCSTRLARGCFVRNRTLGGGGGECEGCCSTRLVRGCFVRTRNVAGLVHGRAAAETTDRTPGFGTREHQGCDAGRV